MIKLFRYEGFEVQVEPEALLLAPFAALWKRDKSKTKTTAKQELGFVYFMCDPRSDYQYIVDEEVRATEVMKGEGMPSKWKPDNEVKRAMDFYRSFKPISAGLLEDTRTFVDKFRERIRNIELEDLDIKELKGMEDIIKEIPKIVEDMNRAEKALNEDMMSDAKIRGSQTKALYEDGI